MILIFKHIEESVIREDAKALVEKCQEFFVSNPERRTATVGVWYGKTVTVRRKHVEADVNKAVDAALNNTP